MNRFFLFILFISFSFVSYSQSFKANEIQSFIDFNKAHYTSVIKSLDNVSINQNEVDIIILKAESYYNLGENFEALELCKKINKIRPGFASELEFRIFLSQNNYEKAKQAIIKNLKSNYKITLYDLINSNEYAGIHALGLDQEILSGNYYSQTEKQLFQVEKLIHSNDKQQALFLLDEIISRKWEVADAHHLKSILLYDKGDFQGSKKEINLAIAIKKTKADYYNHRIKVLNELRDYELASLDVDKLIRLDSYNIDHYITKAELLFKTENFEEAQSLTASILEVLPDSPEVLYLSSKSSYMNQEYTQALKQINQAFEYKSNKEYFELRGDIYLATKTYRFAIQDYSMYLDIDPRSGDIYTKKGLARFYAGDKKGAISDWQKAKRYGSYEAIQLLEKYGSN